MWQSPAIYRMRWFEPYKTARRRTMTSQSTNTNYRRRSAKLWKEMESSKKKWKENIQTWQQHIHKAIGKKQTEFCNQKKQNLYNRERHTCPRKQWYTKQRNEPNRCAEWKQSSAGSERELGKCHQTTAPNNWKHSSARNGENQNLTKVIRSASDESAAGSPTSGVILQSVRRGPIGTLRKAQKKCLPGRDNLDLCLVSRSIFEVESDVRLKHRLRTTLKVMRIIDVPNFDVAIAEKKRQMDDDKRNADGHNLLALKRRHQPCVENCRNDATEKL